MPEDAYPQKVLAEAAYRDHDLAKAIFTVQEDSPDAPRHVEEAPTPSRAVAPGRKTQSEHDWSYAKRALARGDDPETVIQRIADYRGSEKHSGYARRTVEKAQSELQREALPAGQEAVSLQGDGKPSREK
jgi:hypothetical protein